MKKRVLSFSLMLATFISLLAFTIPQNDKYFEILKNLDIFATMYKEVNANYVDDLNPNSFMRTGIDAMLESLDPYTVYYSEDQIEDVRTENTGEFGGIGAIIGERNDGEVTIILPNKGYPADEAGLKRGDVITAVNGIDVSNDYEKASLYLKGQVSSSVNLTIDRPGEGEMDFEVEFKRIKLPNVPFSDMVTEDVGYIKLTGFRESASREVRNALRDLKKEGAKKVILDLRDNGGGLLNEAVNISNIFIEKGELVVTTKGKLEEMNATYKTLNAPIDVDIPLAVLINSSSASASEIVAGVMQDYDRGILVGRKSYGKGLVQRTLPLSYNSQMKVTIAKYYTPSGRCIQAIDYATRNEDGSVGKVADSLKTKFQTMNGRKVFDGGGVDPDFEIPKKRFSQIAIALLKDDLIFEFANVKGNALNGVEDIKSFEVSEALFDEFTQWVSGKDIQIDNPLKVEIEALKIQAEELAQADAILSQVRNIEEQVSVDVSQALLDNKEEIKHLIKEEFIVREYLEPGQIKVAFERDPDLAKAIEVLNNRDLYNTTLAGQ